ncbi:MAG: hypothetical protein Q7T97_01310 [Burkholderiaceae bacterium]|nr:hypothetical protein [Burkholderiaceae bacterium]
MIAARWGMLLVAAMLMSTVLGATASDLQPSAQRVAVTAIVGLLAPLFWPGTASTPGRTALRIAGWSASAACVAAITLRMLGHPGQLASGALGSCGMLMLILLLTHTLAAGLEPRWRGSAGDAGRAREMAGRTVSVALGMLGSLPLWFGPVGELLSGRHDWVIDAAIGMSPLTHLAVASDNDLLHNEWLYQNSNLASLPVSYPDLTPLAWSYAIFCTVLTIVALALLRGRRIRIDTDCPDLTKEKPR